MAISPQNLSGHAHFYFSSELLDQSKHKYISIFALSANAFQSDQIEDGC